MRRAVIGCLLLAAVEGCNRAEKDSLRRFLESVWGSLGNNYDDQLKGVPNSERNVRFRALFAREWRAHRTDA